MLSSAKLPDLNRIRIHDPLWSHYGSLVADQALPYQWDILNDRLPDREPSHCIESFRIAAGELAGRHQGVVFIDSDLYKWLEAVAYCIQNGSGARFEATADEVIGLIGRAQQSDGYLNTYFTVAEPEGRWSNLVEGHELYCAGYLIEAAVAYYQATGKSGLLNVARKMADLVARVFGPEPGQIRGYPGHQEIELALVRLWRCTGDERYLSCARFFIEERGKEPNYFTAEIQKRNGKGIFPEFRNYELAYSQAHIPVREQRTAEGHAVRAMYLYCAMADLAAADDDAGLLDVCRELWRNVTRRRMYITGGIGSSGYLERFTTDYHLPNASSYCETCASIGLALFGRRLAMIERDASYFDDVERALYNTLLAGISHEGNRYFYVNPLEVWPDACLKATSLEHVRPVRQKWFQVACCPTNIARTLASFGQYIYTRDEQTVYVNLLVSSSYQADFGDYAAEITLDAGVMCDGQVNIKVRPEGSAQLRLAVRIPGYAESVGWTLNGVPTEPVLEKGYALIPCAGGEQTEIRMSLLVRPRWLTADPSVREDAGKMALMKGPCVYCLEELDNGPNLGAVFVPYNAAVREQSGADLPGGLPSLVFEGVRLTRKNRPEDRLYDSVRPDAEPVLLRAVPYGIWGNRQPGEMSVWQKISSIN